MSDIISSGMIFSTHSKHNLLHGKGKQTAYCLSGSGSNLVKIHLLKLKFSFSLLLSRKIRFISFPARKYSEVGKFINNGGMQW